ncbi:MAG: JAB domain-containing protein [Bacteroidota bacterium]
MSTNKNATRRDPFTLDLFAAARADANAARSINSAVPEPPALDLSVPVFSVRLVRERDHRTAKVTGPRSAARVACELLDGYDREVFLVVALSTAGRVIGAHIAHMGTVDSSIASAREVYRFAILCNARSVVVAHNHPSGNLEPSRADVSVTKKLKEAGHAIGIDLVDSLVVGFDGAYTSLVERGLC